MNGPPEAKTIVEAARNAAIRRLVLVGDAALAHDLRSRLPDHWHMTLVTAAAGGNSDGEGFDCYVGDGTSALVLERAGIAGARVLIAALGDARANLEVCRLARQRFAVTQVLALVDTLADTAALRDLGVDLVVVGATMATALRNRLERTSVASDGIGLGEGELLQITVHPSSPAVGRALRSFSPQDWTIAAVFRGGTLIIPHGDTVLAAQDSLLLIGQPHVLPAVGEYLRVGRTQFPLPFGPNLVALAAGPPAVAKLNEVAALAAAAGLDRMPVHVATARAALAPLPHAAGVTLAWQWHTAPLARLVPQLLAHRETGCLCLVPELAGPKQPRRRNLALRMALRQGSRPVFLPTGVDTYLRVVLPVAPEFGGQQAAEVAFDLSELLHAPLIVLLLQPPHWLSDGDGGTAASWVKEMADVRRRHAELLPLEGNPLRQVLRQAQRRDLLVLGGVPGRRSSPFRPDPLRFLAERLGCSTLLVPEARR